MLPGVEKSHCKSLSVKHQSCCSAQQLMCQRFWLLQPNVGGTIQSCPCFEKINLIFGASSISRKYCRTISFKRKKNYKCHNIFKLVGKKVETISYWKIQK